MKTKCDCDVSTIYIKDIPKQIKIYFKAFCVKRDKSMRDMLLEMILEKLKEGGEYGLHRHSE